MFCDALALRRNCACLLTLFCMAAADRFVLAEESAPIPIQSGLVVVDGRILQSPYVVAADGRKVTVNGRVVGNVPSTVDTQLPFQDAPANAAIAEVERLLLQDGLLLRHHDMTLLLPGISSADGGALMMGIVESLTSRLPPAEILASLAWCDEQEIRHMTTRRWSELITLFQTDSELSQEIADYCGIVDIHLADPVELNEAIGVDEVELHSTTEPAEISESVQYGVNLFGMLAGVAALGSLLSSRPNADRRWRELDASTAGMKLVTRCGGLIALLGLFDLVCTLMAFHTGMFRELNPVASQLGESPLVIIVFKVAAITAGVGLLWRLRQYSGAQTAAWWMCLVCTLVVFRWLTFHSMFIA